MTTLVTGGTGFLGRFVVRKLVESGESVRVLARTFDPEFAELGVEQVEGSILDAGDVDEAVSGATRVYHLAGLVERDASRAHRMYAVHVDGTRNLLRSVDPSVEKIVVASTSGTVGVSLSPSFCANDQSPHVEDVVRHWPYYLSKIYAERVCDEIAIERGLAVVQLRPALLLGPEDYRESSTGDVVLFLQRKIPTILEGGLAFVDVRDAADAFIAAMERANPGEKYLLGSSNMSLDEFFSHLEEISGVAAPGRGMPAPLALAGARLLDGAFRLLGSRPEIPVESVEMSRHYWYIDATRAERDLGFTPRDPVRTLRDTVRWIERHHPSFESKRPRPADENIRPETVAFARSGAQR